MQIAIIIAQALMQYGPEIAQSIAALLHKTTEPTLDEWLAVFAKVRTFQQIIDGPTPPTTPAV